MKKYLSILIISILLLIPFSSVSAINNTYVDETGSIVGITPNEDTISIYFFYSKTCPHCRGEEEWFESTLKKKYDNIHIYAFEATGNIENANKLEKVVNHYGVDSNGVPVTVIGKQVVVGWGNKETTGSNIIDIIEGYNNPLPEIEIKKYFGHIITFIKDGEEITLPEDKFERMYFEEYQKIVNNEYDFDKAGNVLKSSYKNVPILGKVNLRKVSLPLITIVLGLVDGFNPCAMWILLFLITMLLGLKDRKRMWILGITFLFVSGLIYFLALVGINFALEFATSTIQKIIGLVGIILGAYNISNYIKERKSNGSCQVVDDKKRKNIIGKIKKFTSEKSLILAIIGVIALAVSVNLVEFACSAGLPVVFAEVMKVNTVSAIPKLFLMILYIIVYMLDDIVVFIISMKTLEVTGITNKYSKFVHLIGGLIMILMGVLLIFKPEWIMLNF